MKMLLLTKKKMTRWVWMELLVWLMSSYIPVELQATMQVAACASMQARAGE